MNSETLAVSTRLGPVLFSPCGIFYLCISYGEPGAYCIPRVLRCVSMPANIPTGSAVYARKDFRYLGRVTGLRIGVRAAATSCAFPSSGGNSICPLSMPPPPPPSAEIHLPRPESPVARILTNLINVYLSVAGRRKVSPPRTFPTTDGVLLLHLYALPFRIGARGRGKEFVIDGSRHEFPDRPYVRNFIAKAISNFSFDSTQNVRLKRGVFVSAIEFGP